MYACESGNADCVKVLLENGASLNCSVSIVLILSISCILCTPRCSLKIFVMSYSCTCLILGIMNEVVNIIVFCSSVISASFWSTILFVWELHF